MKMSSLLATLLVMGLLAGLVVADNRGISPVSTRLDDSEKTLVPPSTAVQANATNVEAIRARIEKHNAEQTKVQEQYQEASTKWERSREKFSSLNANESGPAVDAAKTYVSRLIDLMISHIEKLAEKVDKSTVLSEEDKKVMLSELESEIAGIEALKSDVELAETKAELRDVVKQLKDSWSRSRAVLKKHTGLLLVARFENMVNRFESFLERADKRANQLEQKGYDVSKVREAIANAEQKMAEVRAELELARNAFMEISTISGADTNFQEGHTHLVQARKMLVDEVREVKLAFRALLAPSGESGANETNETDERSD
ncbi:MAG: hypothetical protein ACP5KJ_02950 [Candidatus Micrarchaeia archaeon]